MNTQSDDPRGPRDGTAATATVGWWLLATGWVVSGVGTTELSVTRAAFELEHADVHLDPGHLLSATATDGASCRVDTLGQLHHWLNQHLPATAID